MRLKNTLDMWLDLDRTHWPLWVPIALAAGVALWFILPSRDSRLIAAALTAIMAGLGFGLGGSSGRALTLIGLLILGGIMLADLRNALVAAPRLEKKIWGASFKARIIDVIPQAARRRTQIILSPEDRTLPPRLRISLRGQAADDLRPGARIFVRATLLPPPGPSVPGGYDFSRRAWFMGLGAVGFALGPVEILEPAPTPSHLGAWITRLRHHLDDRLRTGVGGAEGGIAAALVTGNRGGIPQDIAGHWRDAGIAHLLSISGLHIATVVGGMMLLSRRLATLIPWVALHWPVKTIAAVIGALAGIGYTILAGGHIPTLRACLAALITLFGLVIGRSAISLRTLAIAATIIIIALPESVVTPSFQLSFSAVAALIAFYESRWGKYLIQGPARGHLIQRIGRWILALILSSLIVEAALTPIALFHFGRSGLYGVVANLIAIPLSTLVIMPTLILATLLEPLGWNAWLFVILREAIACLNALAAMVASWPGALVHTPQSPPYALGLFFLGGAWLLLWKQPWRMWGIIPIASALILILSARPADILVGPSRGHVGLRMDDHRLAVLRTRQNSFTSSSWGRALGLTQIERYDRITPESCSADLCHASLKRGGRIWNILMTRSKRLVPRDILEAACAQADIVVSDRRLPRWCQPKWLKLDRRALERSGAVALWLNETPIYDSTAKRTGDHPWGPNQEG